MNGQAAFDIFHKCRFYGWFVSRLWTMIFLLFLANMGNHFAFASTESEAQVHTQSDGTVTTTFPEKKEGDHAETPWENSGRSIYHSHDYPDVSIETFYGGEIPPPSFAKEAELKKQKELEREIEKEKELDAEGPAPIASAPMEEEQPLLEDHLPPSIPLHEPYRLKVGDKLTISIYGESHTTRDVSVDSSGNIYYLYVDSIHVLGKTIDDLRRELNEKIKVQFKHALVSVTAASVGGEYYTILGEVFEPGQKVLHGKETILSALGTAKGFTKGPFRNETIDFADLEKAFITRRGKYIPVDFQKLVAYGDVRQDIELRNGDYIFIPAKMTNDIFILGEVYSPSILTYIGGVSLVEAVAYAQGLTNLASSRVVVIRGSLSCPIQFQIDFNSIIKRCEPDFILQPGDIVYVPPRRFTMLKQILRAAIATFVSTVASVAGTETYLHMVPSARGNALFPVNTISTGTVITPGIVVSP